MRPAKRKRARDRSATAIERNDFLHSFSKSRIRAIANINCNTCFKRAGLRPEMETSWLLLLYSLPTKRNTDAGGGLASAEADGRGAANDFHLSAARSTGAARAIPMAGEGNPGQRRRRYARSRDRRSKACHARKSWRSLTLRATPIMPGSRRRCTRCSKRERRMRKQRPPNWNAQPDNSANYARSISSEARAGTRWRCCCSARSKIQDRALPRLNRDDYRGKTWQTRPRPEIDRAGSAWLIRKFIDPEAELRLFLKTSIATGHHPVRHSGGGVLPPRRRLQLRDFDETVRDRRQRGSEKLAR